MPSHPNEKPDEQEVMQSDISVIVPSHTPHTSSVRCDPSFCYIPSHPSIHKTSVASPFITQSPQLFVIAEPLGTSAQSVHVLLFPPHTPHSSIAAVPPNSPKQSCSQSLNGSLSQVPQLSNSLSPFVIPSQSSQELPLPSQIPHSSTSTEPPQSPEQSTSAIQLPPQS